MTSDVLFAYDVQIPDMEGYAPWEYAKAPDLVMEMASPRSHGEESGRKRHLYAELGVLEYWQYDPHQQYLDPWLQGWQLVAGHYELIPLIEDLARGVRVGTSLVLGTEWGLDLRTWALRLWNPASDVWYPTRHEAVAERQWERTCRTQAEEQVQQATTAANTQRTLDRLDSLQRALALSELPQDLVEQLEHFIIQARAHQSVLAWDTIPDGIELLAFIRQQGRTHRCVLGRSTASSAPIAPRKRGCPGRGLGADGKIKVRQPVVTHLVGTSSQPLSLVLQW